MKKIRTKLIVGMILVFLVSYVIFMVDLATNQRIVAKSTSLLNDNYPSVKYSFDMLTMLDDFNNILTESNLVNEFAANPDSIQKVINYSIKQIEQNILLQNDNITEPGEKQLTSSLNNAFYKFSASISVSEYNTNYQAYKQKYLNLREDILNIHKLNVTLLENKNEEIKQSALKISNIQEKAGIIGLTILAILIIIIPYLLIGPIDKLSNRMIDFYKEKFNKEITIKKNHELERLEDIFEQVVSETNSQKNQA